MRAMDIAEDDLEAVFSILDADGSGDCEYDEFVAQLWKMKSQDAHTLLVFIKYYITEVRTKVSQQMDFLQQQFRDEAGSIKEALQEQRKEDEHISKDLAFSRVSNSSSRAFLTVEGITGDDPRKPMVNNAEDNGSGR